MKKAIGWALTTLGAVGLAMALAPSRTIDGLASPAAAATPAPGCDADNGGLALPPGFCATIFADGLGHARHLTIAPDGTLYVNTWSGAYYRSPPPTGGFIVALRDSKGDGHADQIARFGANPARGGRGGTGIALYGGYVYAEEGDSIVRYRLTPGEMAPAGPAETVLSGMPLTGNHTMHPFVIDAAGKLYVDMGSATNACQKEDRQEGSPGNQPCTELETRAGTWRYDANVPGQRFSPAERFATGLRNGEGFAFDVDGRLYGTQHGRDQLAQNWGKLYTAEQGAELPSEELVLLRQGADFGWPTCYYDGTRKKLVLAPEYGGDGGRAVGLCASKQAPVAAFPAHWAPNDLVILTAPGTPAAYRGGALIAFHGSWNRAPAPQAGYNLVFQPLAGGKAAGPYVVFADGFAGATRDPADAAFRPAGLAQGQDGAIYVADDAHGRIWKIMWRGGAGSNGVQAAVAIAAASAAPVGASSGSGLPVPPGSSAEEVALGNRIFHGAAENGTCAGCHGGNGGGSAMGASLIGGRWLWSDGSLAGITRTIAEGVAKPRQASGAMPPRGGAPLSDAGLKAVAAYSWAIGHKG